MNQDSQRLRAIRARGPVGVSATDRLPPPASPTGGRVSNLSVSCGYEQQRDLPTLIVDPDRQAATQLAAQLNHAGFHSYVACEGTAARMALQSTYFRSLIVIGSLDDLSFIGNLRNLRALAPHSWLIVISLLSDHATVELVHRCGADTLITVPFTVSSLACKLVEFSKRPRLEL